MDTKHVPGETLDIKEMNIQKLKSFFPGAVSEGKIDFDKLKQLLGEYVDDSTERYNFTWNGKGQSLRFSQSTSTGTLRPCPEESKDWDTTNNLYIEGDNLECLKLLQKSYFEKIQLIYIDPPYNTGKDFVYPDNFSDSIDHYKQLTKQIDKSGKVISTNTEANGRYHTDWLNMIYPRLKLSRNLLKDDGVILISIDDNEIANCLKVCDEIFGEDSRIGILTWESTTQPDNIGKARFGLQKKCEYIVFYSKSNRSYLPPFMLKTSGTEKKYPHDGIWGKCRFEIIERSFDGAFARRTMRFEILGQKPREGKQWQIGEDTARKLELEKKVEIVDGIVKRAVYPEDECDDDNYIPFWSHLVSSKFGTSQKGKATLQELFGKSVGFDTVKPVELITNLLSFFPNDITVLDFFSGSATTAHSVFIQNNLDKGKRKFILVQLPEPIDLATHATQLKINSICELGKERIRLAGEKEKASGSNLDIGFKVLKLDTSNIKRWNPDAASLETTLEGSVSNWIPGRTDLDVVYEILIKLGLPLDIKVEQKNINGKTIYITGLGALIVCLADGIDLAIAKKIIEIKETDKPETCKIVFRDNGFKTDSDKTNVLETLRAAGIEEILSI